MQMSLVAGIWQEVAGMFAGTPLSGRFAKHESASGMQVGRSCFPAAGPEWLTASDARRKSARMGG